MKAIVLGVVLLALCGCATTKKYEKVLNSWVGADELSLVRQWGPPQHIYEFGGSRFLTYASGRDMYVPGAAPSYRTTVVGNAIYTAPVGGRPGYTVHKQCRTTFEIKDEKIVSWRWQGNDCRSK